MEVSPKEIRNWIFIANRKNGRSFTLDGEEITDNYYTKWVSFESLTDNEKAYVLGDYFRLKDRVKRVAEVFKEQILWDEPI